MTTLFPHLPRNAVGGDTESFKFDRGFMAPTTVCVQSGTTDGSHSVAVTRDTEDMLAWMLECDQIWWHNGIAFDSACILEWYPRLAGKLWEAFDRGAMLDTMFLQRMIQIARGTGGPLGLDRVAELYGQRPPTKVIIARHPDTGVEYDVRTSFGLWYMADEIPEPWYSYADYDGEVMLPLANAMVGAACIPTAERKHPLVRLEDLATVCRTYFGLHLSSVYGMHVNPEAVGDLANAAHAAMNRLKSAAMYSGFLKPRAATRLEVKAGLTAGSFCKVQLQHPPAKGFKTEKDRERFEKRAIQHANCPGCTPHATEGAVLVRKAKKKGAPIPSELPATPAYQKDTKKIEAAVVKAYQGAPPLTQPKKDKKTGKRTGGGKIATSRDALQDSGDHDLVAWAEYGEWSKVINADLAIFAHNPIHPGIGVTNNLRPSSFSPNILNFRRNAFLIATCPTCGYEISVDPKDRKKVLLCPTCEK